MNNDSQQYVDFFRKTSPYIHAHQNKTFVINISGETLAHPYLGNIINDIALLGSLGIRLVLVHGARPQIEERLAAGKLKSVSHKGTRITSPECMECVIDAVGSLRLLIESKLSLGLVNSPMHGARIRTVSGNFVTAKPVGVIDGQDLQLTGQVRRIDSDAIGQLLDLGHVVLLSSLGHSPAGELFNLNSEDVASETAIALQADKLILFSGNPGLQDASGRTINQLTQKQAETMVRPQDEESQRLLASAIKACNGGVRRTQLIGFQKDGALLLELLTRNGSGTLIAREPYETVRTATIGDIGGILELIQPLEDKGVLRQRSRQEIEREIALFRVAVLDGMIIGCAALHPFTDSTAAELACLVIHPDYRNGHRGEQLLNAIETQALNQGINQLVALTTQTSHWFIERGFEVADPDTLPKERHHPDAQARQSKTLLKRLQQSTNTQ